MVPDRTASRGPEGGAPDSRTDDATPRPWYAPPAGRALSTPGWVLLPLRLFLGVTFCFAGLQKLANPNFFDSRSPISIQAQLIASERVSPFHFLLGHLLQFATPIGVLVALGELAVGVGTLLGLWTRVAAVGGMLLSATLFFTVSYHSSPYYTGSDIVFFFAWIPMALAGAGGAPSLDEIVKRRARDDVRSRSAPAAPRKGSDGPRRRPDEIDRRVVVLGGAAAVATGAAVLAGAGAAAGLGRVVGGAPTPTGGTASLSPPRANSTTSTTVGPAVPSTATTSTPATVAGTVVGPAKDVPVGGAASFQDPTSGDPALMLQLEAGHFVAWDAVCPHAGCTVGYSPAARLLVCPCHGSEFNPDNGHVLVGPAPHGLSSISVTEGPDGQLYVGG